MAGADFYAVLIEHGYFSFQGAGALSPGGHVVVQFRLQANNLGLGFLSSLLELSSLTSGLVAFLCVPAPGFGQRGD